jgi:branched-chain amino acid transport system ATP-binding protein
MTALLSVAGLRKRFGGLRAIDGVDLDIQPGELRAVIGPNGAGKTTFFNLVTGHFRPDAGSVTFDGADITGLPTYRISRAGIGRAFQITSIFGGLTVHENVRLGIIARRRESARPFGTVEGRHAGEVRELLDAVGLLPVELAISLALEPKLLLLDEPTAGMAPEETERTMRLVRRIADERSLTVLFCEHDMEVVFGTADKVLVMHQGKPLAEGTPDEVRTNPEVQRVYLGSGQ